MALCTFEARVPEGCDCRLAVRRGADGAGGGVLKRVVAGERLEALRCDDEALASFAVRLECDAATGCVSSPPADLAPRRRRFAGAPTDPRACTSAASRPSPRRPPTRFKNPARPRRRAREGVLPPPARSVPPRRERGARRDHRRAGDPLARVRLPRASGGGTALTRRRRTRRATRSSTTNDKKRRHDVISRARR